MKIIADLHIHSKYSRATSPNMDIESLDKWARIKGVDVLGTGDFTHPGWLENLREKLKPAEAGLFAFKKTKSPVRFILTSEISCIYSKNGRVRKIHIIVIAPSFDVVEKTNNKLGSIGNLKADGRPILGLDAKELAKIVLDISPDCLIIPAHIYTPWFSLFGSKSGFNTIEECFEDYSKYIYAGETGLSSDPAMSWRNSSLDKIALVSNSDCHSPQKIGREANVFNTELSYNGIADAIKSNNSKKFLYTIEFFPEEGKYHYDGHRACGISFLPKESKKNKNICPVCNKPLTIGVLNRIEELADRPACAGRPDKYVGKGRVPFYSLIPLEEIIADVIEVGVASKRVQKDYNSLVKNCGSELKILLESSREELKSFALPGVVDGIMNARGGKVTIEPGFDGVYGKIKISSLNPEAGRSKQKSLL